MGFTYTMADKEIKKKTCPICKGEFTPFSTTQRVDTPTCAIEWNRQKDLKKQRKANNLKKRIFYANDIKIRKDAAKKACHKYIRERDKRNNCICCDRGLGKNFDAGHYLESGNNPNIRYDEDNINGQAVYCNQYKGGDSGDYRKNLILKIGLERVERLEGMKGGTIKRTAKDYKEIEVYYKRKSRELEKLAEMS